MNFLTINEEDEQVDLSKVKRSFVTNGAIMGISKFDEESLMLVEDQGKVHFLKKSDSKLNNILPFFYIFQ